MGLSLRTQGLPTFARAESPSLIHIHEEDMMVNIIQAGKNLRRNIKRDYWWIVLLIVIAVICFWAGTAFGVEPSSQKKTTNEVVKREPLIVDESRDRLAPNTTTSTTTTAPPIETPKVVSPGRVEAADLPDPPIVPEGDIQAYIVEQATAHGLDPQRMLRIAKCESGFNPGSVNRNYTAGGGNPSGIYQYLPETWKRIGGRSGYEATDVFNWQQNVRVTMWAFANGYSGEWACR